MIYKKLLSTILRKNFLYKVSCQISLCKKIMKVVLPIVFIILTTIAWKWPWHIFISLSTVKYVDLVKYSGNWFEIARLPTLFESNCSCVTATYTLNRDGSLNVLNQ